MDMWHSTMGCASKTNIQIIERFQNKALRGMVNVSWHVRNSDLHRDLVVEMDPHVIKEFAK